MNLRRLTLFLRAIRRQLARRLAQAFSRPARAPDGAASDTAAPFSAERTLTAVARLRTSLLVLGALGGAGLLLVKHPPLHSVPPGEVGLRTNQFTGDTTQWRDGNVLVLPGLHVLRTLSLRDQSWRATAMAQADGPAPLQSVEGLSFGVDLVVRYALDPARLASTARQLPEDVTTEIIEPAVQGVIYKVFARYTVREAFSSERNAIQQAIEAELRPRLAQDGLLLRAVQIGKVDLPADYRRRMETLLAEELETQKMRYTLDLKEKRVRETELEANADKVRREVRAEAAGREQVIAARAQEEAMKHVLPLKQRQVEQRTLEAEAEKQARVRAAEGNAEARRIEARGEADARQRLAEVEAWRLERVGKANAEQMAREGVLITQHPLLIQKALADKLSDKVQVIIAAPGQGGFIGDNLLGTVRPVAALPRN